MQVPQWAGPIPIGRRGRLGTRAMSEVSGHDTDYFLGRNSFLELEGGSRGYVSRSLLIKSEPT